MTRQELIATIKQAITEQEREILIHKRALVVLGGEAGEEFKSARHQLKNGPIVYGNGHHDGKKKKGAGSNPKPRIDYSGATTQARAKIEQMLRQHPEGLTTRQMAETVTKAGIPITASTIHNALRALKPIKVNNSSSRSKPNTLYALPSNIQ